MSAPLNGQWRLFGISVGVGFIGAGGADAARRGHQVAEAKPSSSKPFPSTMVPIKPPGQVRASGDQAGQASPIDKHVDRTFEPIPLVRDIQTRRA